MAQIVHIQVVVGSTLVGEIDPVGDGVRVPSKTRMRNRQEP